RYRLHFAPSDRRRDSAAGTRRSAPTGRVRWSGTPHRTRPRRGRRRGCRGGGGMTNSIRLLLADDQSLVRGALAALLNLDSDCEVVAEVARGDEVLAAARSNAVDVALLDVEMPGLDGVSATRELRSALPSCRVLIVTTFGRPGYLRKAMAAGASGFV